jgi:hypothetical protein
VCAGVADYFNVDPVVVRIATVVLALSGSGVIAYVLAWIFVPATTGAAPPLATTHDSDRRDRGAQIFGIVLLAVAVSALWGDWWSPARRWMFPLALIALGTWMLLRRDRPVDDGATTVHASAEATAGATGGQPFAGLGGEPPTSAGGRWAPPGLPDDPPPIPRRRGIVGPIVMGALLLWSGIGWLAGVSLENGLAVALCILGVGFVLGAFVGGSWSLIVPAIIIGAALVVASVADIPLSGPVGDQTWTPRTISEVDDRYELSIGEGTLDLTRLTFEEGDRLKIAASVGIGHLVVVVPEGVSYLAAARVEVGDASFGDASDQGVGVETRWGFSAEGDVGTIELDLVVGLGQIELVTRQGHPSLATPTPTTSLG